MRPLIPGRSCEVLELATSARSHPCRSSKPCCAGRASVALDNRLLASTIPAVSGASPMARSCMAATGNDSGAAVNSCILDADRRLTPSGLLVLVLDRLRVFVALLFVSLVEIAAGVIYSADENPGAGPPSLWLSLDASGVGTPICGLESARSRGRLWSVTCFCGGSLGVRIGEGSCRLVDRDPFLLLLLLFDCSILLGVSHTGTPPWLSVATTLAEDNFSVCCRLVLSIASRKDCFV